MTFFISFFLVSLFGAVVMADSASDGYNWTDPKINDVVNFISIAVMVWILNQTIPQKTCTVSGNHPDRGDAPETPGGIEI